MLRHKAPVPPERLDSLPNLIERRRDHCWSLAALMLLLSAPPSSAQGVQASRGLHQQEVAENRRQILKVAAKAVPLARESAARAPAERGGAVPSQALQTSRDLERQAERVLEAAGDEEELAREYELFRVRAEALVGRLPDQTSTAPLAPLRDDLMQLGDEVTGRTTSPLKPTLQAIPQFLKSRNVDFAVGVVAHAQKGASPTQSVIVGTNLAGAATGAVLEGLSKGLQKYFTDFTSIDVQLPTRSRGRIASSVGLGLGELEFGDWYVWPVLGMEQLNDVDERIPSELTLATPDAGEWSSPALAVAVAKKATGETTGKIRPAVIVSVGFPHYFDGSGFSALAALFTDERKEFEKAGRVRFTIGISAPIPRLAR